MSTVPAQLILAASDQHVAGWVFAVMAVLFGGAGLWASLEGLSADKAVQKAATVASQAQAANATALTAAPSEMVAAHVAAVSASLSELGDVKDALAELKGNQAPARVLWAISVVCIVAALAGFDLVALSVAPSPDDTQTTSTVTSTVAGG